MRTEDEIRERIGSVKESEPVSKLTHEQQRATIQALTWVLDE